MSDYQPPIQDMMFVLTRVLGFENAALDAETMQAVLGEAGKLAAEVLAPLNHSGDKTGAKLKDGIVTAAPGFKDAYQQYCAGGWNAVPFPEAHGGQGLPWAAAFPIQEMWQSANMSFGLCPLLNQGAVEAISVHGSEELKQRYLAKLIEGVWTGTMNLTEPQAGSDLGLLRAKAERAGDGTYKITGQKIFITYGEHDMAENIIHLVLARLPDAPDDVKGISLFIVPKFLEDGTRNDVMCTGLEHKLGIHASPTCIMQFGEKGGATGYLIGKEHEGLKCMFTMMNNARLSVGLQGVAIAERALQHAEKYAAERVQGKDFTKGERVTIDHHPDVRRMLLTMRAQVEAGRALTYEAALSLDKAHTGDKNAQARVDLLTPLVKAWCTDMACEVASLGVQVHGGMGFIEETGAAQYYRDARILPIYEGTNGIQAADLVFRKLARDGGASVKAYIGELEESLLPVHQKTFAPLFVQLKDTTDFILKNASEKKLDEAAFAALPYLRGLALIAAGVLMARAGEAAQDWPDEDFARAKQDTAAFYLSSLLPFVESWLKSAKNSA